MYRHQLLHSFPTKALAIRESLPMFGKLLGHRQEHRNASYAHLPRYSVKAPAARVEDSLATDLDASPNVPPAM